MSKNTKDYYRVAAGLGEEVLADAQEEKMISKLSNSLQDMFDKNLEYEEMARRIVKMIKSGRK